MVSKEFAELTGAFVGDGWISKSTGYTLVISGNPKDEKDYYKRITRLWKKEFNQKIIPRAFLYWSTYGIMCCKPEIIKNFTNAGLFCGKKAKTVNVPKVILINKEFHAPFIRGLFDTDGCIYFDKSYNKNASKWQKDNRHIPAVEFTSVSFSLIKSIKTMLHKMGFKFALRKNEPKNKRWSVCYKLRLRGKKNVKTFFHKIQPKNKRHSSKFTSWLSKGFY